MSFKNRGYVQAEISKKAETTVLQGHPWIYDAEVKNLSGEVVDGDLVDVIS